MNAYVELIHLISVKYLKCFDVNIENMKTNTSIVLVMYVITYETHEAAKEILGN